jgi:hypothetical protein
MRKLLMIFVALCFFVSSSRFVLATEHRDVLRDFVSALGKQDEQLAKSYLERGVVLPELKENTRFRSIAGLRSPKPNKKVLVAYFEDEDKELERMAFIWEVTTKNEKITDIRVVYDGSNPFMNEAKAVKEYESKIHKTVHVPTNFPFKITHIDADVYQDVLTLRYRNLDVKGTVQLKVVPKARELEKFKAGSDQFYTLKDGTKALYQSSFQPAYQLIFQHDDLQYYVGIGKHIKQKVTVNDLIQIAESML